MIESWQRVLVLAPHTDDGEFGCGGTMARLVEGGADVRYVAFSIATKSLPDGFPPDTLAREVREATAELGIPEANLTVHDFEVRTFPERRQDILELLIALWEEWRPDAVFQPSLHDVHQDHQVVAAEGLRAFKRTTILGYEIPWNNFDFAYQWYSALEQRAHRAEGGGAREVRLAAAPPLRRPRVHLERRAHARDQREPRVRRGVPGLPRRRLGRRGCDPRRRTQDYRWCEGAAATSVRSIQMQRRHDRVCPAGHGPPSASPTHRRLIRIAAWIVGIVVLLAFLRIAGVDVWGWLQQLWDTVTEISFGYIVLGCLFQGLQTTFTALGWYGILNYAYRGQVTFMPVLASYAAGVALNNFLPANIGTLVTLLMYVAIIERANFPGVLAGYVVQKIFYFLLGTLIYIYLFAEVAGSFSFQFGGIRDAISGHWVLIIVIVLGGGFPIYVLLRSCWAWFKKMWAKAKEGAAILGDLHAYLKSVPLPQVLGYVAKVLVIIVFLAAYSIPVTFGSVMSVSGRTSWPTSSRSRPAVSGSTRRSTRSRSRAIRPRPPRPPTRSPSNSSPRPSTSSSPSS